MSKQMAKFSGLPAQVSDLTDGLMNMINTIDVGGGLPFLKLKNGEWIYGQEGTEVIEDALWAVNIGTMQHGWACWSKGDDVNESFGEIMVAFNEQPPAMQELQDFSASGGEWRRQVAVELMCVSDCEDEGLTVLYKSTSHGANAVVQQLLRDIIKQIQEDATKPIPVIFLGRDSYIHKKHGKTYNPEFEIEEWISQDELPVVEEEDGAIDEEIAEEDEADVAIDDDGVIEGEYAEVEEEEEPAPKRRGRTAANKKAAAKKTPRKKAATKKKTTRKKAAAPAAKKRARRRRA